MLASTQVWEIMASQTETTSPATSIELVDLLTSTQRVLTKGLATLFDEENVTVDQWRILRDLDGDIGRPMGELAASLEIPHPTVTRLVDGLVDSAHLYRTQSDEDRRRVSVHLSHRGQQLLQRLDALAAAHEQSLSAHCGHDAVQDLLTSLRAIRERLT